MQNWKQVLSAARQGESKYKLLVRAITVDIERGELVDGQRLPPQRQVSDALGISVQTVTNAYKELERQGRVRCEVGRGSFVSRRTSEKVATSMLDRTEGTLLDFSNARMLHTGEHDRLWRETCRELADEPHQPWMHAFRPIAGLEHHREAGARWLAGLGLEVETDDLLITNGTAHAIFLALASLAGPDDVVLCEGLTDHGAIGSSQVLGFTLKGLEMDRFGLNPEHFEDMCGNERITALVCTPNLNNPTSAVMPDERRREIAEIARRYGVYIIEDDVYGPLLAGQQSTKPLRHYLPELSFYCTSLTKSVLTGLRVGYLAMPRRLALRTESILRVNSWMGTPLMGEIAARWINGGQADDLVQLQRQLLANRQALVEGALGDYLLGHHEYSLNTWLRVPDRWDTDALLRELRRQHIALTLPDPFMPPGSPRPRAVRLCVGAECSEAQMRKGLKTIRQVFEQYPKVHEF
ncbi:PLP-dependent aminotransferase family protein [Pseudomonas oryzihabitans]|jgi:DNA-binding transcriptional MocR family regulator|uniref:DNA-binding transcriptional regulator, MocR family, contains an aminotransferase domain n=1 Tax=Pseudomonas oryzihabitans TaxID=47885 RepID=A0A1G5PFH9_9PSED|nr:PLP-dependent aminotransferase family protein [Pseudomonas psychrotolerans]NMY92462.1 PLP-dependent aminotransferase family protein [Pseudomonas psychrotolerans]SCZ48302.1 DNA-binding transcriptional regulator, MocR family, contains an aminotransferase domain [Pseudomonas psychrotolerans]